MPCTENTIASAGLNDETDNDAKNKKEEGAKKNEQNARVSRRKARASDRSVR